MKKDIKYETEITEKIKKAFDVEVEKAKSIVITSHFSPDDDSISSVLATYYYLINYVKIDPSKVRIIYTGEMNDNWESLTNFEKIEFVDDLYNFVKKDDLLIVLDGNGYKRFSRKEEMDQFKGRTICIDHHPIPSNQFDIQLIAKQYTSTSEVLYRLLFESEKLTKEISEIILLGLIGDTGNFRYINHTNASVMHIAEKLIMAGEINVDSFCNRFQKINKNAYQVLIELMKNSQITKVEGWPDFVSSSIDMKKCVKYKYSDNDISEGSSNFTNYLRAVEDVNWGMVITPRLHDMTHSVSFRSSPGSVVTREIGEKMGIGGGHDRASGGKILTKNTKTAVKTILDWMKENRPSFS